MDEVIEAPEAFGVFALIDIDQRANLGSGERNVLITNEDLELLSAHSVRLRPASVVLLHDFTVLNNPLELVQNQLADSGLLADHGVVLVVGIVGISELAIRLELELQEFMTEFALVSHIIPQVEFILLGHFD